MLGVDSCVFLIFTTRVGLKTRLNGVKSIFFEQSQKVIVYVFGSKRIDFRAILRNTLGTPLVTVPFSRVSFWQRRTNGFKCFSDYCTRDTENCSKIVGVQIGAITVSTDTVQQLCHSSNLQLQKSAPCTDIHGTQGSQVQILYHKLVPWY